MHDFKVTNNSFFATFFAEHDFVEGEDRLCWTMAGLNKLIALGLGNGVRQPRQFEIQAYDSRSGEQAPANGCHFDQREISYVPPSEAKCFVATRKNDEQVTGALSEVVIQLKRAN